MPLGQAFIMNNKCNSYFASVLALTLLILLNVGCCSERRTRLSVPRTIKDDSGAAYQLLEWASITQLLETESRVASTQQMLIKSLKEKFPQNQELTNHLQLVSQRIQKSSDESYSYFQGIKAELKRSGGELYYYKLEVGKEIERGLIIVSGNSIMAKYEMTRGIEYYP
jgi:hypothetical protein